MKFVIIGAGAVGGYIGARLLQAREDVTFLVTAKRKEQLSELGLNVSSPLGNFVASNVQAVSDRHLIENCDVLIVAVKNYSLVNVLEDISYLSKRFNPCIISMLNGVEHLEKIVEFVQRDRFLGGPLYIEATLDEHGRVFHRSVTPSLTLGGLDGRLETAKSLLPTLEKTGIKITLSEDLLKEFWRKYLFIVVFSSLTSLSRSPIGKIRTDQWSSKTLENLVSEVVNVARAADPKLASLDSMEILNRISNMPPTMTSSMHQDLEKGVRSEVESMQGYLVRKAMQLNVEVPILQTCYGLLRVLETRTESR